jgi:hypothetical protein
MLLELSTPSGCARVPLPAGWRELDDAAHGTAVAVESDGSEGGFRSNLVLSWAENADLSFRDWQVATDQMLPRMLTDYLLLDLERRQIAGRPGGRRLAHHVSPDGVAVTMEQWFTAADGIGWTLTATVDSFRYDEQAELLARAAAGLEIGAGAAR